MKRLLEAGRVDRPSEAVPAGFSRRVLRALESRGPEDPVWIWIRGLRAATFASVAVALVACAVGPAWALSSSEGESLDADGSFAQPGSSQSATEEDPIDQSEAG